MCASSLDSSYPIPDEKEGAIWVEDGSLFPYSLFVSTNSQLDDVCLLFFEHWHIDFREYIKLLQAVPMMSIQHLILFDWKSKYIFIFQHV